MTNSSAKLAAKYVILFAILGLFFFVIPPIDPLTHKGMQMIGLFLAMVFGWTFIDTVVPSIVGIVALSFVEGMTVQTAITASVGQMQVMFLLMTFILVEMVNKESIAKLIAGNILSIKFLQGKPVLMSVAILVVATILGIINVFMSVLLTWAIVYEICKEFNIKPFEKYAVSMIVGIALCSSMGLVTFPFQDSGLILTGMFAKLFGPLNYFQYILVVIPLQLSLIVIWMLGSKYLLRVDFTQLMEVDKSDMAMRMTSRQKAAVVIILLFVGLLLAQGSLPKTMVLTQVLSQMNAFGIASVCVILGCVWHVEGKPMINFVQYAKDGVLWNIFFLSGVVMAFASLLTASDTGVTAFVIKYATGALSGTSPLMFMIILLLITFVLTNFINNIVAGSVLLSLLVPLSQVVSFNVEAMAVLVIVISHFALLTPAASGTAAMLYGNKDWVDMKSIYKFAFPLMILGFLFVASAGIALACIVF